MNRYPEEKLDELEEDDGTMPANVAQLAESVVGHRIVGVEENATTDDDRVYSRRTAGAHRRLVVRQPVLLRVRVRDHRGGRSLVTGPGMIHGESERPPARSCSRLPLPRGRTPSPRDRATGGLSAQDPANTLPRAEATREGSQTRYSVNRMVTGVSARTDRAGRSHEDPVRRGKLSAAITSVRDVAEEPRPRLHHARSVGRGSHQGPQSRRRAIQPSAAALVMQQPQGGARANP